MLILDGEKNVLKEYNQGFYEFSADVIKAFESSYKQNAIERKDNNEEAEIKNLLLRHISLNDDGSISLFGEEYYDVYMHSNMGGSRTTTVYYYYDDIYGVCIDKEGKLKWMVKIPKRQEGIDGNRTLSFMPFFYKGNTYVFFMDNPKNMGEEVDEVPAKYKAYSKGGVLAAVKIEGDGKTSKTEVYSVKEEDVFVDLTKFQEVGKTGMITRAWHKKNGKIASVSFQ